MCFREYGLHMKQMTAIPDDELDIKIRTITLNRNIGYRGTRARLLAQGVNVPFHRVRDSMLRVDPGGLALRWGNTVQRRCYNVKSPNELWHIDGNHKLIRWKFIVHGGIDGYSRLITYLGAATNNRAGTVLELFKDATVKFGMPSRVRMDEGVENADVARFVNATQGVDRGSVLIGTSVHNQRIERLWVDVFKGCLALFYQVFMYLEEQNVLDVSSDEDMFCLHYVFKPVIDQRLKVFQESYNRHPLTTSGNRTPYQLFVRGTLENIQSNSVAMQGIQHAGSMDLGIDPDAPPAPAELTTEVVVDEVPSILSQHQMELLRNHVDPTRDCQNGTGIDVYIKTIQYVAYLLRRDDHS